MDSSRIQDVSSGAPAFVSPFDNFLHYVPKEHELAVRQALYNAAALALLAGIAYGAYYVGVILEPFLLPIFWALLTGFVLHPYKTAVAERVRQTLQFLSESPRPAAVVGLYLIAEAFLRACETVGYFFVLKWRVFLSLAASTFVSLYLISAPAVPQWLAAAASIMMEADPFFSFAEGLCLSHLTALGAVVLGSYGFLSHRDDLTWVFQAAFGLMWSFAICYILNSFWTPVTLAIGGFMAYSTLVSSNNNSDNDCTDGSQNDPKASVAGKLVHAALSAFSFQEPLVEEDETDGTIKEEEEKTSEQIKTVIQDYDSRSSSNLESTPIARHLDATSLRKRVGRRLQISRAASIQPRRGLSVQNQTDQKASAAYVRSVLLCCILLQFYLHPRLLHLLPVSAVGFLIRQIWRLSWLNSRLGAFYVQAKEWVEKHNRVLMPSLIAKILNLALSLEKRILRCLPPYVDLLVTTALILFVISVAILSTVFLSLQLYEESSYMVQTTGQIFAQAANTSVFRKLNETFWDESYQSGLESAFESAYHSGRAFLQSSVHDALGEQASASNIEEKVLEVWDRLYQYWLDCKRQMDDHDSTAGPTVTRGAVASSLEELMAGLSWSSAAQFFKDNMGTMTSVMEQTWSVVKDNAGLVATVLAEAAKLLLLGGSGVVNFTVSVIVYFTALFYLLSDSSRVYRPQEMLARHGHLVGGRDFARALSSAVTSIFWLTIKMAGFYGCWTYLTHTVFGASVVAIPVLCAAFLAAVPLTGQYVVCLPGALELWLSAQRPVSALFLVACHILPTYIVDGTIYAEVQAERGMHPWLTALSIVGGIYYFGIAGAIYGPLILCAVFAVVSMYPRVVRSYKLDATPFVKRSESVC